MSAGMNNAGVAALLTFGVLFLTGSPASSHEDNLQGVVLGEEVASTPHSETSGTLQGVVVASENTNHFVLWSVALYKGYVMVPAPVYTPTYSRPHCHGH
jgi:hypothetical protein